MMFRHEPLTSPRSIRLLRLKCSPTFRAPLELELFEGNLDSNLFHWQGYEALSYVWGSSSGTQPVLCDDELLFVTPNCESALRHLRLNDTNRILWIDAICIDQSKTKDALKERNAQVALMGEIYKNAKRTLCWLGEGTPYTESVIHLLAQIGNCPSQRGVGKLMDLESQLLILSTWNKRHL